MVKISFCNDTDGTLSTVVVIIAKMNGKWVLCKHKDRDTYELPGGHREQGESIYDAACRELKEETGATAFTLDRLYDYSMCATTQEGENVGEPIFGSLFYAKITAKDDVLASEIENVVLMDNLPDNLTYPMVTRGLIEKAQQKISPMEKGTAYILVYDEMYREYYPQHDPFVQWLISEGFSIHGIYRMKWRENVAVYVNINYKTIAFGMPGIRCFEEIGNHAITIDEFKTIYAIYKKYEGKKPFVFD